MVGQSWGPGGRRALVRSSQVCSSPGAWWHDPALTGTAGALLNHSAHRVCRQLCPQVSCILRRDTRVRCLSDQHSRLKTHDGLARLRGSLGKHADAPQGAAVPAVGLICATGLEPTERRFPRINRNARNERCKTIDRNAHDRCPFSLRRRFAIAKSLIVPFIILSDQS